MQLSQLIGRTLKMQIKPEKLVSVHEKPISETAEVSALHAEFLGRNTDL